MNKYTINEDEVGKEYLQELIEIIKIRIDRKKIYGDSFLSEKPEALLSIINGKQRRFTTLYNITNKNNIQCDKMLDEIYDIINYYLFIACTLKNVKGGDYE